MQNEEWNVSAVSLSPELVRLAQQKQARLDACRQAAENGNEAAITELGINYFYGTNGAPEDPDAAFYWLSRTSPENAAGRCFLGACYVIGKGTKQDEKIAVELFQDSAALGFPPAQYELGLCYEHGIGLERNMARAVELYALAAEQEDAQAQCALGNLYFTGNGVEQDRAHAAELYTRAAEQGDVQLSALRNAMRRAAASRAIWTGPLRCTIRLLPSATAMRTRRRAACGCCVITGGGSGILEILNHKQLPLGRLALPTDSKGSCFTLFYSTGFAASSRISGHFS